MASLAAIPEAMNIEIVGILDSHYWGNTESISGIPVIGDESCLLDDRHPEAQLWKRTCSFFPANWHNGDQNSGLPTTRIDRINLLDRARVDVCNLIHPAATVTGLHSKYGNFKMGRGVLVQAGALILADNVEIGDYCAFEAGSSVTHDTRIGRNVMAAPRTFIYNSDVKDNVYFGIFSRCNAVPNRYNTLKIGNNVTIWNSAEVTRDVPDDHFYTTDGRILRKKPPVDH
jgi:carbonic anhydrase/acetyltransferase-like protein (isoleucine patch superfamily)